MSKLISTLTSSYKTLGQKIGAMKYSPSEAQGRSALFLFGIVLLTAGISAAARAQGVDGAEYNDERMALAVGTIFQYIEGSFGALIMTVSGLGAILSSAFGQYKAALGCLVVCVGAFILRSLMHTFFNTEAIDENMVE